MNDGADGAEPELRRLATIRNRRGLHARAAARFVKLAWEYDAEVTVANNGTEVSGRSIMGLMMLAAGPRYRDRAARQRTAGGGRARRLGHTDRWRLR